uniref:Uncharacterized protein n=1 Tax=Rousettus aegyptiacus TaxID=9407 RepID=A0A7J8H2C5_ROUAE|nr:hypothetical protein HJG63_011327 [Rousettus aegyptiacus]
MKSHSLSKQTPPLGWNGSSGYLGKEKEVMQTGKERGKERGGKERDRENKQTKPLRTQAKTKSLTSILYRQREKTATGLYPQEVIWMSKGQAAKVLSGLTNPPQGEEASGTLNALQQRPTSLSSQETTEKNCSQTHICTQRHKQHT